MEQQNQQVQPNQLNNKALPPPKESFFLHNWLHFAIGLIVILLVVGGILMLKSSFPKQSVIEPLQQIKGEIQIQGTVTDKDSSAREVDGDGIVKMRTTDGQHITVLVPSGEAQCIADTGAYGELRIGDSVEVFGEFANNKTILCESPNHYLRKAGDLTDPTTNWQTYRNDEFGFEVEYPEEWNTEQSGPNYIQKQIERGETISGTVAPTLETISFFSPAWQANPRLEFTLTVSKTSKEIAAENYDNLSFSSSCDPRFLNERPKNMQVVTNKQGVNFLEVKVAEPEKYFSCYYSKNSSDNKVAFEVAHWGSSIDFEDAEKYIQEILSTFRFMEETTVKGQCALGFHKDVTGGCVECPVPSPLPPKFYEECEQKGGTVVGKTFSDGCPGSRECVVP